MISNHALHFSKLQRDLFNSKIEEEMTVVGKTTICDFYAL